MVEFVQETAHKEVNLSLIQEAQKKRQMKQVRLTLWLYSQNIVSPYLHSSVADPDFELRRRPGAILLAQLAFFPSVISSFFSA